MSGKPAGWPIVAVGEFPNLVYHRAERPPKVSPLEYSVSSFHNGDHHLVGWATAMGQQESRMPEFCERKRKSRVFRFHFWECSNSPTLPSGSVLWFQPAVKFREYKSTHTPPLWDLEHFLCEKEFQKGQVVTLEEQPSLTNRVSVQRPVCRFQACRWGLIPVT